MKKINSLRAWQIVSVLLIVIVCYQDSLNSSQTSTTSEQRIYIGPKTYEDSSNKVQISGTMIGKSYELSENVRYNKNTFTCYKEYGYCNHAYAELSKPDFENGDERTFSLVAIDYPITEWTEDTITMVDDSPECVRWQYRINRFSKELIGSGAAKLENHCEIPTSKVFVVELMDRDY